MPERPCDREWGAEKGRGVRELIVKLTGKPCPCDQGNTCPLLPEVQQAIRRTTARSGGMVFATLAVADVIWAARPA